MIDILVLAGGGAKGLMQLKALEHIERMTGKKIWQIFNYIFGSSVGSINGGVLASGISANEFMPVFYKELEYIFDERLLWTLRRIPKYDRANFTKVYKKLIDENFLISDCKTNFICSSVNIVNDENTFFKSYKTPETLLKCMLRSFAAPMFFGQMVDRTNKAIWMDGGIGTANLPLDWAETEMYKLGLMKNPKEIRFTAIGTGYSEVKESFNDLANDKNVSQVMEFMSLGDGGFARKQVIKDQVNRFNIKSKEIGYDFRYIDVKIKKEHDDLDLIKYKDKYMDYGDEMIKVIKQNNWNW